MKHANHNDGSGALQPQFWYLPCEHRGEAPYEWAIWQHGTGGCIPDFKSFKANAKPFYR